MEEVTSLFDFLPNAEEFKPKKSTDWKWSFKDYPKEKNGLKVFSCFACGGGSTMGYKLAGCEVVGCCEIDPKMNEVYKKNHNPKYNYLMDIRDFNNIPDEDLPPELFNLDILDGSPPCTTFSMAGEREESWGKKKKFREGQAEQTLDDLSFIFINTVSKLKPKCVIMENVEGLIKGEAWKYVQQIYKQFTDTGYKVRHWLLKGEQMGVPQKRHRVFFIAVRNDVDFDLQKVDMSFNYEPVKYRTIREGNCKISPTMTELFNYVENGEKDFVKAWNRKHNPGKPEKRMLFNEIITYSEDVIQTIRATGVMYDFEHRLGISDKSIVNATTFPQDYNFMNAKVGYVCGMSVPPVMVKRIVTRLIESGLF